MRVRWEYIQKEEGAELVGPWEGPGDDAEGDAAREGKRDDKFVHIRSAPDRTEFEARAREFAPYEWIIHHDKFMSYADKHWKAARARYESVFTDFPHLPAEFTEWVNGEFRKPNRPKTLCVWGPTRTGKTEWARSLGKSSVHRTLIDSICANISLLGPHIYMNGQFNAAKLFELDGEDEPEYIVLDDIDIDRFFSLKEFFGAQREFDITDKYMKKRTVYWGKPCIWLSNRDPMTTENHDREWIRGNTVIFNLTHQLYDEIEEGMVQPEEPAPVPIPGPSRPASSQSVPITDWAPTPPPPIAAPAPQRGWNDLYPPPPEVRYLEDVMDLPHDVYGRAMNMVGDRRQQFIDEWNRNNGN